MQISVIIPLYNKEGTVKRAIDSVLAQTYSDVEVIVVDDGSTDHSLQVALSSRDPRVRVIRQHNAGVSAARNRGSSESRSDLVAFIDADDAWLPTFLETVLQLRNRFPSAAVWATAYEMADSETTMQVRDLHGRLPSDPTGGLIDYFAGGPGHSPLHPSAALVWRPALQAAGGFPEGVVRGEDHDAWIRLALRFPIAWTPVSRSLVYTDADNRTDGYLYSGYPPYFRSYSDYISEGASRVTMPLDEEVVLHYLGWKLTMLLKPNWLAGNRQAMRDIVRDCRRIRGYRARCYLWYVLSFTPRSAVRVLWKSKAGFQHGSFDPPECRQYVRER